MKYLHTFRSHPFSGLAVRLLLTCWLVYSAHFATNIVREIYPALSLGDHFSFDVSEYVGLHPDIFPMPGRGAFINNNPGASVLGAVPYALARPIIDPVVARVQRLRAETNAQPPEYATELPNRQKFFRQAFEQGLDVKFALAAAVIQTGLMAPLSALSVVALAFALWTLTASRRAALWLAVLYAFATPIFYRTAQLNHNLILAHLAFFAFLLLWRPWGDPHKPPHFLLAGFLTGATVIMDYSGLVAVMALGAYALAVWRRLPDSVRKLSGLVSFGAGLAIAAALLMAYQWASFGHPLFPAQSYMPPTKYSGYGFAGIDWPSGELLWLNLFGLSFGLFAFSPLLLLAFYPPAWYKKEYRLLPPAEMALGLGFFVALLLFSSANRYAYMQFNTGVRYLVPTIPFLFFPVAATLQRLPQKVAVAVGAITVYWSWTLAMYRQTAEGLGVLDAVADISINGPRLPWLTTLQLMGYVPNNRLIAAGLLLVLGIIIIAIWNTSAIIIKNKHKRREKRLEIGKLEKRNL